MKEYIKTTIAVITLSLISFGAMAQGKTTKAPKWVSEKGYWVVESNRKQPLQHIVRFYNNDDVLIYKESLKNVRLNTNRRKVKMKLKSVLETSALAWEKVRVPEEDKNYVVAILK